MKYRILKAYRRKYNTGETEVPVTTVVVKYRTENGYIGKIELPGALTSTRWIEEAIKKDIENAKKICVPIEEAS